jgi:PAS domain-containing protein
MTSRPDDRADAVAAEAAELVADMRAAVDEATTQLERMTDELTGQRAVLDRLESIVDLLLDLAETPVIVVDADRRIAAVSRAAARGFEGAAVGKPLSSVLPEPLAEQLAAHIDRLGQGAGGASTVEDVRIHPLPGGAMLVLTRRVQDGRHG